MSKARRPLPTDLMALVTFDGRVHANQAVSWERLGPKGDCCGPHPLETALEQWFSFATGKHTWVNVRGATIQGLVSARCRSRGSVWEVDCLIDAANDNSIPLALLSRMTADLVKVGAERIFLRLRADSPLVKVAGQAGFFPYTREVLYRTVRPPQGADAYLPLRERTRDDLFAIFQLYTKAVPASIRAIEGPTLQEWQAALEPWGKRPLEFVLSNGGIIEAAIKLLPGQCGRLVALTCLDGERLDKFVQASLARLSGSASCASLVPCYAVGLALSLEQQGFAPVEEYVALAKRLVRPAEELAAEKMGKVIAAS